MAHLLTGVSGTDRDSDRTRASSDGRIALRSQLASFGLVLVLLGITSFAIWSSQVALAAARSAAVASTLSDNYTDAAHAVAGEESLERKYRLEPQSAVRATFDATAARLVGALSLVARNGDQRDKAKVKKVLAIHSRYLESTHRMFDAVDKGDARSALRIDAETEPLFGAIEEAVLPAAEAHHQYSLQQLAHLLDVEKVTGQLTPMVFLAGLLLAALLTSFTRVHRRLLDAERSRALHDSMHDSLTGLPNRTLLFDRLGQALLAAKRSRTTPALLLIDLDRFKDVNDTFGHHYGDALLAQIGTRLRSMLRGADTVARLGGDEFGVLLPDIADLSAATALAAKLRATLEEPFTVEGIALDVEASIGVVLAGEHGTDPTLLLQRADIAMYIAKAQNLGVFAYDPEVDGHSPAKLALLGELRYALSLGQLVLHYQPKVSITTSEVVGAEALVRWQHPDRGLIYPDSFIPLAERHGSPIQLLWTWASPNLEFATVFVGVIGVLFFGLSFWMATLAILVGTAGGALTQGILSTWGPKHGLPQMVIGRSAFGFIGNLLPAGLMSVTAGVGWFAVNSVSGALALNTLTHMSKGLSLVIIVAVQIAVAFFGHNLVQIFERFAFPFLAVVFLIAAGFIFSKAHLGAAAHGGIPTSGAFLIELAAAFGYAAGWNPYASDYSRYLRPTVSSRAVGLYAGLGIFLSCAVLEIVGAASVTAVASPSGSPTGDFTGIMPTWIADLTLLAIALGAISANVLNIYSGAMSFLAMGVRLPLALRRALVALVFGTIGLFVAFSGLHDAGAKYEQFLLVIAYWIGPWLAVVFTDRLLRRGTSIDRLVDETRYQNWAGPIAMLVGVVVSIWLFCNQVKYLAPIPKAHPGIGDITFEVGFVISAVTYLFLFRLLKPRVDAHETR